jgi:hypothetical protein
LRFFFLFLHFCVLSGSGFYAHSGTGGKALMLGGSEEKRKRRASEYGWPKGGRAKARMHRTPERGVHHFGYIFFTFFPFYIFFPCMGVSR